jgi:hypothetical protein
MAFLIPTDTENFAILELIEKTHGLLALTFNIAPFNLESIDIVEQDPSIKDL